MVYLVIYLVISISILLLIKTLVKRIVTRLKPNKAPPEDNNADIINADILENLDRQIDGYYQLLRLLDAAYNKETDEKKKAIVLSKQIATLEKLNKAIERREKLD